MAKDTGVPYHNPYRPDVYYWPRGMTPRNYHCCLCGAELGFRHHVYLCKKCEATSPVQHPLDKPRD